MCAVWRLSEVVVIVVGFEVGVLAVAGDGCVAIAAVAWNFSWQCDHESRCKKHDEGLHAVLGRQRYRLRSA